jgi:hypothetical protein
VVLPIGVSTNQMVSFSGPPVTRVTAAFTQDAMTRITPRLMLDFWPFNYLGAITTSTTLTASNDHGADLADFELKMSKVEALTLTLADLSPRYQKAARGTAASRPR